MTLPCRLAVLVAALSIAPAAIAGEPPADVMTIATESVTVERSAPGDKDALPHATQDPTRLELSSTRPVTLKGPPPEGAAQYAEVKVGTKTVVLQLVKRAEDSLEFSADANGDGTTEAFGDAAASKGKPLPGVGGRTSGLAWTFEKWTPAGAPLVVAVRERFRTFAVAVNFPVGAKGEKKPTASWLFGEQKPAAVKKAPEFTGTVQWASGTIGEKVIVLEAAFEGDAGLALAVDLDADGDLTGAGETFHLSNGDPQERPVPGGVKRTGTRWALPLPKLGDGAALLTLEEQFPDMTATVNSTSGRRGTAKVDGVDYALFLLDADFDGAMGSEDDLWWFGPVARFAGRPHKDYSVMFEATEAAFAAGKAWRLVSVAADGTARVAPAAKVDLEAYLHRRGERVNTKRWFPRFNLEKASFAKAQQLDPARPHAPDAPKWHHVLGLDEAVALAKAEGKPLLVDFEADWCVWCKRIDFYTYGDAEVASWLAKFTLAKINVELDESSSYDRQKDDAGQPWSRRGLPGLGIFSASGSPVDVDFDAAAEAKRNPTGKPPARAAGHVTGFQTPANLVEILKTAHAAFEKDPAAPGGK